MRKALIAGFFDKVEAVVRDQFGAVVDRGDIVIAGLGRVNPRHGLNVESFKQGLSLIAATGEACDLLVVVGNSASWVGDAVLEVLVPYGERHQVSLHVLDDLRDSETIATLLVDFGMVREASNKDAALLSQALAGQRLFCVRASKQASFERTLARLGFPFSSEQFVEEDVAPAQNSNLVQLLSRKAEHFDWLLYAWAGLRTLPAEIKRKFRSGSIEADSPMKVCTMLKQRLLKRSSR